MVNNTGFDYDVINDMMGGLTFNNTPNVQLRNKGGGNQMYQPQPAMLKNPAMTDPFGDYFDDGLVRGAVQPAGYFQRQAPIDGMDYNDYRASIV